MVSNQNMHSDSGGPSRRLRSHERIRRRAFLAVAVLAALLVAAAVISLRPTSGAPTGRAAWASGGRCREVSHAELGRGIRIVENLRLCYSRNGVQVRGVDAWFRSETVKLANPFFRFAIESPAHDWPGCRWQTRYVEDSETVLAGSGWISPLSRCQPTYENEKCSCSSGGVTVTAQLWAINTVIARIRPVRTIRIVVRG
jgi:hypothetical protein